MEVNNDSMNNFKRIKRKHKGCKWGCLISIGIVLIFIVAIILFLNNLFPSPPNKEEINYVIIKNEALFEEAVVYIKDLKKEKNYIDVIEHTKFYTPEKNPKINGLFTGGVFNGEYIQSPIQNQTIEKLFISTGVQHITIFDNYIEFSFGGAGRNYYCGAVRTYDGKPVGFDGSNMELQADGKGWSWKEDKGDNKYYIEKVIDNWFFYEAMF